ncbi:hypothetical protein PoB_006588700 [Plakobranchus ocellatus]|uniref:Uncharacterized protein n=1 Tax=Plakobranchus ocellatus TaxID=259542 RepID=A0AAV4D5F6_9GAST|nr:hypothetical protein PoB_006588700 [Plakobranchus ocellatus]
MSMLQPLMSWEDIETLSLSESMVVNLEKSKETKAENVAILLYDHWTPHKASKDINIAMIIVFSFSLFFNFLLLLIEGLTDWLKAGKSLEAIEATKDRKKWRTMIANAVKQGT